jgi:carbon storage regulator
MLVFRRALGEAFMVGDSVEVRILAIGRKQVKIGVNAPREVGIYRTEISQMNRSSVVGDPKAPQVRAAAEALRKALHL